MLLFIPHWADVAKCLMQPLPVVEHLDVIKDRCTCLVARIEGSMPGQLVLQVSEEAFCHRIVMAIAFRSEEHTSELQSRENLVCRLLLEKKKNASCTRHSKQL